MSGILVKVTVHEDWPRPTAMLWVVATDDPVAAIEAVRKRGKSDWTIEVQGQAPAGYVERQKLAPGQACPM